MKFNQAALRLVLTALGLAAPAASVSFRGPVANATHNKTQSIDTKLASVANATTNQAAAPKTPAAVPAPKRARLDVGFAAFEKNVTDEVAKTIDGKLSGEGWNSEMRAKLVNNVTGELKLAIEGQLHPLKVDIGQTWMAFASDDDKDKYVETLRSGFESVLERSTATILSHAKLSVQRISKKGSDTELAKAEATLASSLLKDHCYNNEATQAKKGNATAKLAKFCIPSVVNNFARRLNDTQNLIGMTMKFESRALTASDSSNKAADMLSSLGAAM